MELPVDEAGLEDDQLAGGEEIEDPLVDGYGGYTDKDTLAALGTKLNKRDPKKAEDRPARTGKAEKWTPPAPAGVSKRFVKTVASLRRSGLEIVFCFDSTGSMGPILDAAKADLLELFELVQELVPRTRMGIITYRDRGDEYVTRATRLGVGRFEALAFLSSVTAGGGGDYPEAVDEALLLASKFPWRPGARKITILVGDAPPHENRMRRAVSTARRMSKRNGQVHVLVSGVRGERVSTGLYAAPGEVITLTTTAAHSDRRNRGDPNVGGRRAGHGTGHHGGQRGPYRNARAYRQEQILR